MYLLMYVRMFEYAKNYLILLHFENPLAKWRANLSQFVIYVVSDLQNKHLNPMFRIPKKKTHPSLKQVTSPTEVDPLSTSNVSSSTSTPSASNLVLLPQIPLPLTHFTQTMTTPPQIVMQTVTNIIPNVQTTLFEKSLTNSKDDGKETVNIQNEKPTSTLSANTCTAKILALRRGDLLAFGTSILRPEAALHKVHNSSRKAKHVVIDELWKHYVEYHPKELLLNSNAAPGWVGEIQDDEEDK